MMRFILSLGTFVTAVLAAERTTAPEGAITVGSGEEYSTIQAAIDSLSTESTETQSLFILAGTYAEQVTIPERKASLKIYGYTKDTSGYASNEVIITHDASIANGAGNNQNTGTVINQAANTAFYNIDLKNTYGQGSQAGALSAYGDAQGYYGVGFYGYQDTLLAQVGNQVYAHCYIEGATDFIYGQYARAWIHASDIRVSGAGWVTANGRASSTDVSYYVINKSTIDKASASTAETGAAYLGRPWGEYARVVVQSTSLSSVINSAGWEAWGDSDPTGKVTFQEYENTGDGASGTRASFSSKLSSAVTIDEILGSEYTGWVDTSYLS